jgi:hypothetical protein
MRRFAVAIIAICMCVSCSNSANLPGFAQVANSGKMPLEYVDMVKSGYINKAAYEVSLQNVTSDQIISFDYTMVLFDNEGAIVSYEDKNFGGNNIVLPGEKFSLLAKMENDADQIRFLLKSVSWKEESSGALFKWNNPGYDEQLRFYRLKGLKE